MYYREKCLYLPLKTFDLPLFIIIHSDFILEDLAYEHNLMHSVLTCLLPKLFSEAKQILVGADLHIHFFLSFY